MTAWHRMTDPERIVALEAENAALRGELEHWRRVHQQDRYNEFVKQPHYPVGIEQPHPVGERPRPKPREVFDEPLPAGSLMRPAPAARGVCETCRLKMVRGEPAVCFCIQSTTVIC